MVKGLADGEGKSLIVEIRFSGAWLIEPPEAPPERLAEGSLRAQCPSCLWSHFRTVGRSVCLSVSLTHVLLLGVTTGGQSQAATLFLWAEATTQWVDGAKTSLQRQMWVGRNLCKKKKVF